jgi:hypothetical protein
VNADVIVDADERQHPRDEPCAGRGDDRELSLPAVVPVRGTLVAVEDRRQHRAVDEIDDAQVDDDAHAGVERVVDRRL